MKILVVGGGGREHAIIKKIKENPKVSQIFAAPGNGGIAMDAICVDIPATDLNGIKDFAIKEEIDFAVVAPDDPLVLGLVDILEDAGIPSFGPNKNAAIVEGSKAFSKELMKKFNIPTAKYQTFDDPTKAIEYIKENTTPIVIKADGLALGKGVIIPESRSKAIDAVKTIMEDKIFGSSGNKIVIEELLTGPEVSVLAFTDGKTLIPMISSMDHKRVFDGDKGPNTGGMGVIAPNPYYTDEIADRCMKEIFLPTIKGLSSLGREFKGCLYFGLMLTKEGPKVIEYNCRFGDPEAQAVLPLLESDLLDIMIDVRNGHLDSNKVIFSNKSSCCLVLASSGYPTSYEKGYEITCDEKIDNIFFAGVKSSGKKLLTSGGRVLGVTEIATDLKSSIEKAYKTEKKIHFDNKYFRKDIGQTALKAIQEVK